MSRTGSLRTNAPLNSCTECVRARAQCADRVEWVRMHERRSISMGFQAVCGGALRLAILCSVSGQLAARDDAASAAGGAAAGTGGSADGAPLWSAVYLPFALGLGLVVCCIGCCCVYAPAMPPRAAIGPGEDDEHAHENGHGERQPSGGRRLAAAGSVAPGHSRGGSGSSNDGTAPLLSSQSSDGGSTGVSPHLL